MTDPARLIDAPVGAPGSGRVRYAAAMALWQAGLITDAVLEVYRVAAAHDGRDPRAVIAGRGLPQPPAGPQDPVRTLYTAARDYLLALHHPGAAEVRAGLPADPGPARPRHSRPDAVAAHWLVPALHALTATRPALARAIGGANAALNWITYDAYPRDRIGDAFATNHAFAPVMGEDAPFTARDFDLGLFVIAPGILYRDHHHAAPELYAPLTGPHGWRFGPGRPLIVKPAHQPVWNPAHRPHLTKVGPLPFLALFVWTRDVNIPAQVIPADDWTALEADQIVP